VLGCGGIFSETATMTESRPIAQHIQEIEAYLENLVEALRRGELPVNLQRISQVFDRTVTQDLPRLTLNPEQFVTTYNDVPMILAAYAIEANITSESLQGSQHATVLFGRELGGNYWIVPMNEPAECAWLVLNPHRKILFDRLQSLPLAFDFDKSIPNLALRKPSLVKLLPTEPPTWQVLQRGQMDGSGRVDSGNDALRSEIMRLSQEVRSLTERNIFLNQRIDQLATNVQDSNNLVNSRLDKFKDTLRDLIRKKL
jgi:hypothetical protein